MTPAGSSAVAGTGDYTYSGVALRDIKEGKIAASTVDRLTFTAAMTTAGKTETLTGEVANLAAYDFDAASTRVLLDPAHAKDDKYYRAYRQMTAGAYTASFEKGLRMRVDGVTIDDVGLRPSKLQFPDLMAIIEAAPPPGTTPTPEQMRELLGKVAGIYEGIRIGGAEVRGLSMDTPEGAFSIAAIRLANLENGKLAEFAFEGLEAKAPQGPVKIGRFALKSLDVANLMRVSGQFSTSRQNPSPDQLVALLLLLEGTEIAESGRALQGQRQAGQHRHAEHFMGPVRRADPDAGACDLENVGAGRCERSGSVQDARGGRHRQRNAELRSRRCVDRKHARVSRSSR